MNLSELILWELISGKMVLEELNLGEPILGELIGTRVKHTCMLAVISITVFAPNNK